ncbi:Protein of unknown function DUF1676 [Cinara cedri]|uniref:Uncharacterized protein n=1 Tax=Cinara cedri TaxID=506608 RepID=A0A5E4MU03_9HEMI|nr:Protein of unknown function DUF1676 [Cinara cedri]
MSKSLALACVAALAFGRGSDAFCGLRADGDGDDGGGGGGGTGDFVSCLKAKAIATLDRLSRADALPLADSVTLVRDEDHRRRRSDDRPAVPSERELLSKPDDVLDRMLYDGAVGLLSGRAVRVGLPELTPDQIRNVLDEGRGKMKKTMGMMMTAVAMKAMMVIPLALGLLFLMAGKAMIISKIALVLSLIITLKKLVSKTGGSEHVVHESHAAAAAWPPAASPVGYAAAPVAAGWDRRSSHHLTPVNGQMLAYRSHNHRKP